MYSMTNIFFSHTVFQRFRQHQSTTTTDCNTKNFNSERYIGLTAISTYVKAMKVLKQKSSGGVDTQAVYNTIIFNLELVSKLIMIVAKTNFI